VGTKNTYPERRAVDIFATTSSYAYQTKLADQGANWPALIYLFRAITMAISWSRAMVTVICRQSPSPLKLSKAVLVLNANTPLFRELAIMTDIPIVSFVIPCYRLSDFLTECVQSVLAQSYNNLEIIILDDQSPDETPEVAQTLISANPKADISYIRNETNLGNIGNYNKGIAMARGSYVWILSPDDRLRSRHIVERYVRVMESNPHVGYALCPAHIIQDDHDLGELQGSVYGPEDRILNSNQFVKDMVDSTFGPVAASVMVRKDCYERVTFFPEDMPHRGDTYVWSMIAMRYGVAYFSEAMVDYRVHDGSMMSMLSRENMTRLLEDDIAVAWRIKAVAEERNLKNIVDHCKTSIILIYKAAIMGYHCRGSLLILTLEAFEASLLRWEPSPAARSRIRATLGKQLYWFGMAELFRGHIKKATRVLRFAFDLDPKLRYNPPLAHLMSTPDLDKRVVSIIGEVTGKLLAHFAWRR
jgi:glycosyltransferase involved in cell wall biosynthesis